MLKPMDFCVATSRKGLRGSGLEVGETGLVMATKPIPINKSDPYLQRIYVVLAAIRNGKVEIPGKENKHKAYLVDPRCLTQIEDEDKIKELKGLIEAQYDPSN